MKRNKLFSGLHALLLKALIVVLILSLLFGVGVRYNLLQYINQNCKMDMERDLRDFQNAILESEQKSDQDALWREIRVRLSEMSGFGCYINVFWEDDFYGLLGTSTQGCASGAVLLDENGQVVSSGRSLLYYTDTTWDEWCATDDDLIRPYGDRIYLCDPTELQIPELDHLLNDCRENMRETGDSTLFAARLTSAYVNSETHRFIPCTGYMSTEEYMPPLVNLHVDLPGYELVPLQSRKLTSDGPVPEDGIFAWHFGDSQAVLDELAQIKPYTFESELQSPIIQYVELSDGYAVYEGIAQLQIFGEPYWVNLRYKINYNAATIWRYIAIKTGMFALICGVLAVLICKWKSRREKAARESFRISLTDSLAHDIKTPLMAISGYAENIRDGNLPEEKQKKYVSGILDNVAYTDSLISRTLYLNHLEQGKKAKAETVQLAPLAEKLLDKYKLMLQEKRIQHSLSGSAEVQVDPSAMETILENLISNAVKYTPEGGKIQVTMDQKALTVTNSVAQKISVKKLKEPFYRGDAARSNVKGNGLGLAIADRAANANGFKLKLSCTEHEFKAELKF